MTTRPGRHTPRPSTVLACGILIDIPSLISFATGNTPTLSAVVYLGVAIVLAYVALSIIAWIWDRYARQGGARRGF